MSKYRNFNEQVDDNLKSLSLFNEDLPENYWDELFTHILDNTSSDLEIDELVESIWQDLEGVYQVYQVTLKGDYNQNHVDMQIIYDDDLEIYLMPVYCFGISWSMVAPLHC